TRSYGDWSSDVCSSDLRSGWSVLHGEVSIDALLMTCTLREAAPSAFSFLQSELEHILLIADSARWSDHSDAQHRETLQNRLKSRSEERRVGKECRKRGV